MHCLLRETVKAVWGEFQKFHIQKQFYVEGEWFGEALRNQVVGIWRHQRGWMSLLGTHSPKVLWDTRTRWSQGCAQLWCHGSPALSYPVFHERASGWADHSFPVNFLPWPIVATKPFQLHSSENAKLKSSKSPAHKEEFMDVGIKAKAPRVNMANSRPREENPERGSPHGWWGKQRRVFMPQLNGSSSANTLIPPWQGPSPSHSQQGLWRAPMSAQPLRWATALSQDKAPHHPSLSRTQRY